MAEYIFKDILKKRNLENEFYCESAACSREEIGHDIYPQAKQKLVEKNIYFDRRKARQVTKDDIKNFDYIVVMDRENIDFLKYIGLYDNYKITRLLSYTDYDRDISDPWYTGNFETTYNDIVEGIDGFLSYFGY